MQQLILALTNGARADVEAVEALLILAEWMPHSIASPLSVGRGEEDRTVWMYVGLAVRLGYYLDLDQTASSQHMDMYHQDQSFARRRLAWTGKLIPTTQPSYRNITGSRFVACYMSDRNICVRLGRGFWSRNPGSMTGFPTRDFPWLQPANSKENDYATILQARLELTQIFSNAHDILYSRKGLGWKLMIEGDYIKYIVSSSL